MMKYRFEEIAYNCIEKKKPVEEDKYNYIGLEHLDTGCLYVNRYGSEIAPIGEKLIMHKGDVLFGKRRAYQKKVAIAPFDGIFSAHGMVLRPREDVVNRDFFPLFISSDYFLNAAIKISVGSLSPTINWSDLKELEFDLPDLNKQIKLAAILWSIISTLESYKKLLYVTDEIVKSQFIEQFSLESAKKNNWPIFSVYDVINSPLSGDWGKEDILGDGIRVLRTANFTDEGRIDFSNIVSRTIDSKKIDKLSLIEGDILIEKSGGSGTKPVGRVVVYEGTPETYIFNNFTALIRADVSMVNPYFLFEYLYISYWNGETVLYENKTTGMHNLRLLDYLQNLKIPIPPLNLQENFALLFKQSDKSKFEIKQALDELNIIYKRILADNLG